MGGGVYGSAQISVTKVLATTLLVLRGVGCPRGGVSNFQKKALCNNWMAPISLKKQLFAMFHEVRRQTDI